MDEHTEATDMLDRDIELRQANVQSANVVNLSVAQFNQARATMRLRFSGCVVALTMFGIAVGIWALVRFG